MNSFILFQAVGHSGRVRLVACLLVLRGRKCCVRFLRKRSYTKEHETEHLILLHPGRFWLPKITDNTYNGQVTIDFYRAEFFKVFDYIFQVFGAVDR